MAAGDLFGQGNEQLLLARADGQTTALRVGWDMSGVGEGWTFLELGALAGTRASLSAGGGGDSSTVWVRNWRY